MERVLHCEITNKCPLDCKHCYCQKANMVERSNEFWITIAKLGLELGFTKLVISGGEPLLRSDIANQMISIYNNANLKSLLLTSGWIDVIPDNSIHPNCIIQVSLDGINSFIHDSFRKSRGSWKKAITFCQNVVKRGGKLWISHAVRPETQDYIVDMYNLAYYLGAERISFNPVVPQDESKKRFVLNSKEKEEVISKVINLNKYRLIDIRLSGILPDNNMYKNSMRITSQGNVLPFNISNQILFELNNQKENIKEALTKLSKL